MALNYSHRPTFSTRVANDSLVSPLRVGEDFGIMRPGHVSREMDEWFDHRRDRGAADRCGPSESVSKDIIDLLPSDPFGMDISTTFTAITGWLEDLEVDYEGFVRNGFSGEDYNLFAGLNLIWNDAMTFQSFPTYTRSNEKNASCNINLSAGERGFGMESSQFGFVSARHGWDVAGFDNGSTSGSAARCEEKAEGASCCTSSDGAPHEAIFYALGYLGVKELLSVEMVCRSLRSTVRNDPLLWRNIHIDQPLNDRITDDILMQLTNRAQGNLRCLSLVECPRITDNSLRVIMESNPRLTKLCVPGCTKLSIDGIMMSLKVFNSKKDTTPGIKNLRIGGIYGVTHEHFEQLKYLLGTDGKTQEKGLKPLFYLRGNIYLLCDDDRAIDVEVCPRCQKLRLVYDCPSEGCQTKDQCTQVCRACSLCIARCVQCGRCINDSEYEETFCLELLCSDCFNLNCQDRQVRKGGSTQNSTSHVPSLNFSLDG